MKSFLMAAIGGLIACAGTFVPAHAQDTDAELERLAKEEGQVVWYTIVPASGSQAVADAFMQRYPGIQVDVQRLGGYGLWERLSAEHAAGRAIADVFTQSVFEVREEAAKRGIIAKYVPPVATKMSPLYYDANGYSFSNRLACIALAYNTNLVPDDKAPKEWRDLLDPAWAGQKIGILDARATGVGFSINWQIANEKELGKEYLTAIAAQKPVLYEDSGQMVSQLASGEYPIMVLPEYRAWDLIKKGAPIKVNYPSEGVPCSIDFTHLIANASHPNAAKLFMNYYASPEGADQLAKSLLTYSPVPDAKTYPLDSGRPSLSEIKPFEYDLAVQAADQESFSKWFGETFD